MSKNRQNPHIDQRDIEISNELDANRMTLFGQKATLLGVPVYKDALGVAIKEEVEPTAQIDLMRDAWVASGGSAEEFDAQAAALRKRMDAVGEAGWYAQYRNRFDPRSTQIASVAVGLNGKPVFLDENGVTLDI